MPSLYWAIPACVYTEDMPCLRGRAGKLRAPAASCRDQDGHATDACVLCSQTHHRFTHAQGRPDNLRAVVASLRAAFGLRHIYCWHGLSAYWSGVAPDEPGMAAYQVGQV